MKILIKAHVVTALLGWIFVAIGAGIVVSEEGSLPALLSLCLFGVVTVITIVDLLSAIFAKRQQPSSLPTISIIFWGMVLFFYGLNIFSQDVEWQGRIVLGLLILTALFKIMASASILKKRFILERRNRE